MPWLAMLLCPCMKVDDVRSAPPLFLPYSKSCLRNRHGEDAVVAAASGCWECPVCRGSCGKGCVKCCNCGPCRKKVGAWKRV